MQTFGEQLTAARKAKGMTQEALAQAAAVTRQTVSSWERGRTIPDLDTIRRLSGILGADLIRAVEGQSATPVVDSIAPPEGQDAPAAAGRRQIKKWWIIAGAAVLVCVALSFFLLFPRKPAPAGGGDVFNAAYYQQETANEAGKAYFVFDNRVWENQSDGTTYQMYEVVMHEQNGVAFNVIRVDAQLEGNNGVVKSTTLDEQTLRATLCAVDVPAFGTFSVNGGFPKGEFVRGGFTVYGTDENGEALTFYSLMEF